MTTNKELTPEKPMKAKLPKHSASSNKEEKTPRDPNDLQKSLREHTDQLPKLTQEKIEIDPKKIIEEDGNIRFIDVTDEYEDKGFVFLGGIARKGAKG